jgi:hypothetical protein
VTNMIRIQIRIKVTSRIRIRIRIRIQIKVMQICNTDAVTLLIKLRLSGTSTNIKYNGTGTYRQSVPCT